MTTELAHAHGAQTPAPRRKKHAPGNFTLRLVRSVLLWERAWPAFLPALAPPYLITLAALFGLWAFTPVWLHQGALIIAAAVFAALVWRDARRLRLPTRREAQARLEQDGGLSHAPLQALDDRVFAGDENALWRAHKSAMAQKARRARLKGVRNTVERRDPLGLRYTALGLFAVALAAAGPDWRARVSAALDPGAAQAGRVLADVWIEPPIYTRKAPIYLMRAGQTIGDENTQIDAPEGSQIVAQINARARMRLVFHKARSAEKPAFERKNRISRASLTLNESGLLQLRLGGADSRWPIGVIPDLEPRIEFRPPPGATDDARLTFGYALFDDYGASNVSLRFRLDREQQRPLDAPDFDESALGEERIIELRTDTPAIAEFNQSMDLQSDPWAGLAVLMKIVAVDGAGKIGQTPEISVVLPARTFFNPLAKSVIEQRQTLSIAAENWSRVGRSLDAITLAPATFFDDTTDYLLLRTAFWRIMRQDKSDFADAVSEFWPLALQLEDKALELARQRLSAAQEALREALERGADDNEINRLVEELRAAMNDYLNALAQSGAPEGQTPRDAQMLENSDLDEMLNAIRDLANANANNAARQMLSDLENLLNNLRLTQGGQGQGERSNGQGAAGSETQSGAGQAGDLIGRQRELADETFQRGQSGAPNGEQQSGDDIAGRQRQLSDDLADVIETLRAAPDADPQGDARRALENARDAMADAEQALRNEDIDGAGGAMERAISRLREGAGELAREEMRQARESQPNQNGAPGLDPLGRPTGDAYGYGVEVPGQSEAGRARAVIDMLRKRLEQPGRSQEEIEYLERLLERF